MEINYELILKYLANKQSDVNSTFSTKKNNNNTYFPDKFKNLLNDNFSRLGVSIYDNDKNNISFWSSLLIVLNKNDLKLQIDNEFQLINKLKNELIEEYNLSSLSYLLKNITKNEIKERMNLVPDEIILQYIVDILDISIIVFDFKTNDINLVYSSNIMNPWKQIVLLANYDILWEPIILNKSNETIYYTFDYNILAIKKILIDESIKYYKFNKSISYINNLNDIVKLEKTSDISIKIESNKTNNDTYNESELNKLKRDELVEILTKYNIVITSKKLTKTQLINMILENNKNDNIVKEEILEVYNKTKLNKMTKEQLIEISEKYKIQVNMKMLKKDIIDLIMDKINDIIIE